MSVPAASALKGLRVLIVDDHLDSCVWMTYFLELYGINVHSTSTVNQGLAAFVQLQPDVVLSDIVLPDEDGYLLLQRIRQLEAGQDRFTPIVAITGLIQADARFEKVKTGFNQWLVKPIDADELVETIAHLTGRMSGTELISA